MVIPLMDEQRINWYLRNYERPGFVKAIADIYGWDGWNEIKEKLILSMKFYGYDIPEMLENYGKGLSGKGVGISFAEDE